MNIMILGGSGFLGSHLCERLLSEHNSLIIYNRSSDHFSNIEHLSGQFTLVTRRFEDETNFDDLLKNVDYVYHLISSSLPANLDPLPDLEKTVKPTLHLLKSCVKNKVKKIIFFSSGGTIYGVPNTIPIPEHHPTDPVSVYGIQKLTVEKYLQYYRNISALDYTILRIANPYGERQAPFCAQGFIAALLGSYFSDKSMEIWGDGLIIRDFIYVKDVIDAAVKALHYKGSEKIFNIGSGMGYSLNEVISVTQKLLQSPLNITYTKNRLQDVPKNVLNIKLAKKELQWSPSLSLNDGIAQMIASWNPDEKQFNKNI